MRVSSRSVFALRRVRMASLVICQPGTLPVVFRVAVADRYIAHSGINDHLCHCRALLETQTVSELYVTVLRKHRPVSLLHAPPR